MSDFEEKYKRAIRPHERAHEVLDAFSIGEASLRALAGYDEHYLETAAFTVMLESAADINSLEPRKLSKLDAPPALEESLIRIAAVGMERDDIAAPDLRAEQKSDKRLHFVQTGLYRHTVINEDCAKAFDRKVWEDERVRKLKTCIEEGASIICFGEFDYPPQMSSSNERDFEYRIQSMLDLAERPIFLFLGSRHDYNGDDHVCTNTGRIFVSSALEDIPRTSKRLGPLLHPKRTPAVKAMEMLSPMPDIQLDYYKTSLGFICILICVDAYNPNLVLTMLEARQRSGGAKLDYILVPAYNYSTKLYYACQVLSLLAGTYVLLVDACKHSSSEVAPKPQRVQLFFEGRAFADLARDRPEIGRKVEVSETDHIKIWELDPDFQIGLRAFNNQATPLINRMQRLYSSDL